jgi:hypothetical protein
MVHPAYQVFIAEGRARHIHVIHLPYFDAIFIPADVFRGMTIKHLRLVWRK